MNELAYQINKKSRKNEEEIEKKIAYVMTTLDLHQKPGKGNHPTISNPTPQSELLSRSARRCKWAQNLL